MADLTVYIGVDPEAQYDPKDFVLKPGDSVEFKLDGRTDTLQVSFTDGLPFGASLTGFTLSGATQLTSQQTHTVADVVTRLYHFEAKHVDPGPGEHEEPAGTVSGDLDVSNDSPPKV